MKKYFKLKNGHKFSHTWESAKKAAIFDCLKNGTKLPENYSWSMLREECKAIEITAEEYFN